MEKLSKHEAEFELLKVVAKAIENSGDVLALANGLEKHGAPRDLINDILETRAVMVMDEAHEAIRDILEVL